MTGPVTFFVLGLPAPKGSTRSFRHWSTGRTITVADNAEKLEPWALSVSGAARAQGFARIDRAPVAVGLTFCLPRPLGHYGVRGLRPSARRYPWVKPDLDKLVRAVGDALTGVVYLDDAQVVRLTASKVYADGRDVGVEVVVEELGP